MIKCMLTGAGCMFLFSCVLTGIGLVLIWLNGGVAR
jgi:hypothetical protein